MAYAPEVLDLLEIVRRSIVEMVRGSPPGYTLQALGRDLEARQLAAIDRLEMVVSDIVKAQLRRDGAGKT